MRSQRLFFLGQPDRHPAHSNAVENLFGLEIVLDCQNRLRATDKLLHQQLGVDSLLRDRQRHDLSGRIKRQEEVESAGREVIQPRQPRLTGELGEPHDVGKVDNDVLARREPAETGHELRQVRQRNEIPECVESTDLRGADRDVGLHGLHIASGSSGWHRQGGAGPRVHLMGR